MVDEIKCRFCEINKLRTRIVGETKNTITILSNPALTNGHLLVIPKKHAGKLSELNEEERKELFDETVRWQEILLKTFWGCDIRQNCRLAQKEDEFKVFHLHMHLQPREFEDELYQKSQIFEKQVFKFLNQEGLDEIHKFIEELKK